MVLVYVLVILALTSTVVVAMLNLADASIGRSQRFSEAAAAQALIAAGEASALIALRRDQTLAPEVDHGREDWAGVAEDGIEIGAGRFRLKIADAQGLFNLNSLPAGGVLAQDRLRAIVAAAGLEPDLAARILALFSGGGAVARLADLTAMAGATDAEVERLSRLVAVLPGPTPVNVNAAPVEVLAVLLANPVQARLLVAARTRAGFLTAADVQGAGVILPAGLGFRSDFFRLRVTVQVGETVQSVDALIQRQQGPDGAPRPVVVARGDAARAGMLPPS